MYSNFDVINVNSHIGLGNSPAPKEHLGNDAVALTIAVIFWALITAIFYIKYKRIWVASPLKKAFIRIRYWWITIFILFSFIFYFSANFYCIDIIWNFMNTISDSHYGNHVGMQCLDIYR